MVNSHEALIKKLERTAKGMDSIQEHENAEYFRHLADVYRKRED